MQHGERLPQGATGSNGADDARVERVAHDRGDAIVFVDGGGDSVGAGGSSARRIRRCASSAARTASLARIPWIIVPTTEPATAPSSIAHGLAVARRDAERRRRPTPTGDIAPEVDLVAGERLRSPRSRASRSRPASADTRAVILRRPNRVRSGSRSQPLRASRAATRRAADRRSRRPASGNRRRCPAPAARRRRARRSRRRCPRSRSQLRSDIVLFEPGQDHQIGAGELGGALGEADDDARLRAPAARSRRSSRCTAGAPRRCRAHAVVGRARRARSSSASESSSAMRSRGM